MIDEAQKLKDQIGKLFIEKETYRNTLLFIANDPIELSYEKAELQRNDYKERAAKALDEFND